MEKEAFGIDHTELGHFIAVKWRFPEEFADFILKTIPAERIRATAHGHSKEGRHIRRETGCGPGTGGHHSGEEAEHKGRKEQDRRTARGVVMEAKNLPAQSLLFQWDFYERTINNYSIIIRMLQYMETEKKLHVPYAQGIRRGDTLR